MRNPCFCPTLSLSVYYSLADGNCIYLTRSSLSSDFLSPAETSNFVPLSLSRIHLQIMNVDKYYNGVKVSP